MVKKESLPEFYALHGRTFTEDKFSVHRREDFACAATSLPANRRDFYKISLITGGEGVISFADKSMHVSGASLAFLNPLIPYSWKQLTDDQTGYFCLFTEDFMDSSLKNGGLAHSPLFKVGGTSVFLPAPEKVRMLSGLFENMLTESQSEYANKLHLLKSYLQIIMHEALKMQPHEITPPAGNASVRLSDLFIELLERQFPIGSPQEEIRLKNANEFAAQLSVHTNHLNRVLKETTGKTTSAWISEKILAEAKTLLIGSNFNIGQIGYCLGFEHPTNFNSFFIRQTGQTPNRFRKSHVCISSVTV